MIYNKFHHTFVMGLRVVGKKVILLALGFEEWYNNFRQKNL